MSERKKLNKKKAKKVTHKYNFHSETILGKLNEDINVVDMVISAKNSEEAYIYINQLFPDFLV